MTEIVITNVEDVVKEAEELIKNNKNNYVRNKKMGHFNMANSAKGSIIGIVQLLARITDKSADDYFKEIFPEEYGDIE